MVDRRLTIKGSNIRYREFGESRGSKRLLFLHGLGSSSDRWVDLPEASSRHYHTVAVDLIGFGDSDLPLGGYIAAEVAIRNRSLVDRLVLVDSSGMLDKPTPLLNEYLEAAVSASPEKVKKVFEQLVAQSWRVFPILVELFINRINRPGAKHAFESAFLK